MKTIEMYHLLKKTQEDIRKLKKLKRDLIKAFK